MTILLALLLAQVPADPATPLTEWAKLGVLLLGFAAFLAFVRHTVYVVMPAKEKECREERAAMLSDAKEAREKFLVALDKHHERAEQHRDQIIEEIRRMNGHDRPSGGATR